MSALEALVILGGLVVGYLLVSKVFFRSKPPAVSMPRPWHEVLKVPESADRAAIEAAYQDLSAQYQPDKVASLGPELRELAARRLAEVSHAYQAALQARADPAGAGSAP
jgi:DnaJ like chaperone protein